MRWREERGVRRDLRHAEELFGALVGAGTRDGRGGRGSGIQAYGCANRKRVRFRERGVSPAPLCLPTARATGLTLGRRSGVVVFFWAPGGPRFPLLFLVLKAPALRCVFYTAGQISQIQPRASRSENFSSDAAPKFPTKFPRFTVPRVQRFGLGQWGNSSWTPPRDSPLGGCHDFPVSTEYYSILCNLCRDGKEKGAKSERLKVERVELRRVQEGRRHAKVRRERPGQLPSNQNGGRDILPHRRGCRPLLVPPFLSRSSPSRRRQLDHIGVPHKNGACG